MKQTFSPSWISSVQPRKQRKYRYQAPLHLRRNMLSIHLSKDLRKKYHKRNFPVRKGDTVSIMSGEFKGKLGKVDLVNYKKLKVRIEGIFHSKKDGTKVGVLFSPSKLTIKDLLLEDNKRKKALERTTRQKQEKKVTPGEKEKNTTFKKLPQEKKQQEKEK